MEDEVLDAPQGAAEPVAAPETQEQPSLRDTIAAAVAKQREPAKADVPEPAPKPESEAKAEPKPDGRTRDDKGRFAKPDAPVEPKEEAPKPEAKDAPADSQEAPKADAGALRPPTSWSPSAKVAFDKLPPEVQQAVSKREEEVNKGFAKFQEYKPLDQYIQLAKESGTTLDQALSRYVNIERELQRDFIGGITQIARQQNINPVALANAILARHGAPAQPGEASQQPAHQTAHVDLTPIQEKLSALESFIQDQQQAGVQSEIQRFASDPKHPFFDNVKADMGRLIEAGQAETLDDAYDMACWANKEIRALLIKQQQAPSAKADDAVQRARAADKATGGAPSPGMKAETSLVKPGASIRDTVMAAVARQRGI